ncbi:MAG TPA: YdeI/OmpD-associated family protein [Chitinophagaceae bacterium]
MSFPFKAKIYKVGINPCVKVPQVITSGMIATKGYIPVKGMIENYSFQQTLVPVKGQGYRLYVNEPMLKGGSVKVGQTVHFEIEQDNTTKKKNLPVPKELKKKLEDNSLQAVFHALTPYRRKEVLRYLNNLKTEAALKRNIDKVISVLKGKATSPLFRIK